jgi:hypothetical protein
MLVHGTNKVGGYVNGILGKGVAGSLKAGLGEVGRPLLSRIEQQLDSVDSRISPGDLTTPLELGRVILVVKDQSRDFGLPVTLQSCRMRLVDWDYPSFDDFFEGVCKRETLTRPRIDGDNVRLLARGAESVSNTREGGAKVERDDQAFSRRVCDGG